MISLKAHSNLPLSFQSKNDRILGRDLNKKFKLSKVGLIKVTLPTPYNIAKRSTHQRLLHVTFTGNEKVEEF